MPTKTKKKAPAKKAPTLTLAPPKLSRATAHTQALDAIQASLDADGEKYGESVILELRNEFDKVKHHLVWKDLFARARFGAPK